MSLSQGETVPERRLECCRGCFSSLFPAPRRHLSASEAITEGIHLTCVLWSRFRDRDARKNISVSQRWPASLYPMLSYSFARAVLRKCHRLGGLSNKNLFLQPADSGSGESGSGAFSASTVSPHGSPQQGSATPPHASALTSEQGRQARHRQVNCWVINTY